MALDIKIKSNAKAIQKRYKRLESKFPSIIDKGILQAGFQLLDIIRTKTQKGIDFNSKPFAPYSEGYLKRLQKDLVDDNKYSNGKTVLKIFQDSVSISSNEKSLYKQCKENLSSKN